MFTTTDEFIDFLRSHSKFSMNLGLERMERACELLGNPQLQLKTIHVAGTNGKGSTCNYLMHLLKASGFRVGLFVSPYIEVFNERIQMNGDYISDDELIKTANKLLPVIEQVEEERGETLTEFEIITLLSYVYFYNQKVDYVIYEVGLGGRFDATNVIHPIVAGITNISLEHTDVLGHTISQIAYEKIGIAKPGITLFTTERHIDALTVFKEKQHEVFYTLVPLNTDELTTDQTLLDGGVSFSYLPFKTKITLPLIGFHQVDNAVLALQMYQFIMEQERQTIDIELVKDAIRNAYWPGRIEIISKHPFIILDGSHNEAGVKRLIETMMYYINRGYKIHTIFTALRDKDTKIMIEHLETISSSICFTSFPFARASRAKDLACNSNHPNKWIKEDFKEAIKTKLQHLQGDELLLITGSLYFISQVKHFLQHEFHIEKYNE